MICCYSDLLGSRICLLKFDFSWTKGKFCLQSSCTLESIVDYVSFDLKLACGWCGFFLLLVTAENWLFTCISVANRLCVWNCTGSQISNHIKIALGFKDSFFVSNKTKVQGPGCSKAG